MNRIQLPARAAHAVPFPGAVRSSNPADVGLDSYAAETTRMCPYLAPSMRGQQARWTRLPVPPDNNQAHGPHVEATLFASGLWAAEQVRERAAAGERLACEVVAVDWPTSRTRQESAMAWPHWALKCLLAPVGVVCGKFAPAIGTGPAQAETVMVLALRVAVPAKDGALLARTPELARTVVSATDDGRAVLTAVPGLFASADPADAWPTVRDWAGALPQLTVTRKEDLSCVTT